MRHLVHRTLWQTEPGFWQSEPLLGARTVLVGDIIDIPIRRARRLGLLDDGSLVPLHAEPCPMCVEEPEAPGVFGV